MVKLTVKGNYNKTKKFLQRSKKMRLEAVLEKYGKKGVEALSKATPIDTGKTASSWTYVIRQEKNGPVLSWNNTNRNNGVPIALIIQYGHATGTGAYIQGRDYINPALRPIFDEIADSAWKEVISI